MLIRIEEGIITMKKLSLFVLALAVLGLTACEKTLVEDIADVGNLREHPRHSQPDYPLHRQFFGSGGSGQTSDGTFRLTSDGDWDSVNGYTF